MSRRFAFDRRRRLSVSLLDVAARRAVADPVDFVLDLVVRLVIFELAHRNSSNWRLFSLLRLVFIRWS